MAGLKSNVSISNSSKDVSLIGTRRCATKIASYRVVVDIKDLSSELTRIFKLPLIKLQCHNVTFLIIFLDIMLFRERNVIDGLSEHYPILLPPKQGNQKHKTHISNSRNDPPSSRYYSSQFCTNGSYIILKVHIRPDNG